MSDTDIEDLPDDPAQLKGVMKISFSEFRAEIADLKWRLALAQKARFGQKSERHAPGTPTLFDLGTTDAEPTSPDDAAETESDAQPKAKPRTGRRPLPKNLPRVRVEHVLPENERVCPCCGKVRQLISWSHSDQLEYEPAKFYVLDHARANYACGDCEGEVITAPKPPQPIDKGLPAPGLLAAISVSKYGDHLPLYRMEEILLRSGLHLARSTQCQWMMSIAMLLQPLVELMKLKVLASRVIWTDDTTLPVLDDERDSTKTGRIWVYIGDPLHRYAVFDYSPDRKSQRPQDFLGKYSGYLQADAYSGYDEIVDRGAATEVACWAHARRKFVEAKEAAPTGANYAVERIKEFYAVEHRATKRGLTGLELAAFRQEHAAPKIKAFEDWLDTQRETLLPKSPLAQAVRYAINQRVALRRYLEDGELTIDNNLSERTIRCVAIGRKNWLFAGSDRGGEASATLMSLIASCKLLGVDPYRYLRDVLARMPALDPQDAASLSELLPDRWLATHPEAQLIDRSTR